MILAALWLGGCVSAPASPTVAPTLPWVNLVTPPPLPTSMGPNDMFSDIPAEARNATRLGDPRPPAYWMLWNRCASENRAEWADANGGRAAGWTLMDDLLAYPGVALGDYTLKTCTAGLALLQGRTVLGEEASDPLYALASALLTAELNLGVGAETCPILEEAVVGGHLVLSSVGFDGEGTYEPSNEVASAISRLVALLEGYNRGELCK